MSASSIKNYVCAIKTEFCLFGLRVDMFEDPRVKYYQRSVVINRPFVARTFPIMNIKMLENIVLLCDTTYMGQIFKAVYLTAFFPLLEFLIWSHMLPELLT